MRNNWLLDLSLIILLISLSYSLFLGARPLAVPDEGRYAEIPREMVVNHDYLIPHINNIQYFEKPPLFYWMQAAAIKQFGTDEWSIRLANLLMGIISCALTYVAARIIFDRRTGWLAALILATSLFHYSMSHMVTLDMTVSTFITACLCCFLFATRQPPGYQRRLLIYLAAICSALAVLTKGLIGILLPSMIIGIWITFTNNWKLLRQIYLPSAMIIFLLIALPWHILVQLKHPEFFRFYFIEQHFLRYATLISQRYQPVWHYIPIFLLGLLPWTMFFIQSIYSHGKSLCHNKERTQQTIAQIFLFIWTAAILIFFSFSKSKLIPYIAPAFPPSAILIAAYLARNCEENRKGILYGTIAMILFWTGIGIFALKLYQTNFHQYIYISPHAGLWIKLFFATLIGSGIIALLLPSRYKIWMIILGCMISWLPLNMVIKQIKTESTKQVAMYLSPKITSETTVFCYERYFQDLPFYLQHPVKIINWRGELVSGAVHQPDANRWLVNEKEFLDEWHGEKKAYLIVSRKLYTRLINQYPNTKFYIVAEDRFVLVMTNKVKS